MMQDIASVTGPLVVFDGDIGNSEPPCYLQVGAAIDWAQAPAGLGNLRRDETFVLDCALQWHDGGSGQQVASGVRQTAFAILENLVQLITADPTLGGSVRFAQMMGGGQMEQGTSSGGGWSVLLTFHVRCEIQLER